MEVVYAEKLEKKTKTAIKQIKTHKTKKPTKQPPTSQPNKKKNASKLPQIQNKPAPTHIFLKYFVWDLMRKVWVKPCGCVQYWGEKSIKLSKCSLQLQCRIMQGSISTPSFISINIWGTKKNISQNYFEVIIYKVLCCSFSADALDMLQPDPFISLENKNYII